MQDKKQIGKLLSPLVLTVKIICSNMIVDCFESFIHICPLNPDIMKFKESN